MKKVVYIIFVIIIKNLEMRFGKANLFLEKSTICFNLLTQKKRQISKRLIYHIKNSKSRFYKSLCLS